MKLTCQFRRKLQVSFAKEPYKRGANENYRSLLQKSPTKEAQMNDLSISSILNSAAIEYWPFQKGKSRDFTRKKKRFEKKVLVLAAVRVQPSSRPLNMYTYIFMYTCRKDFRGSGKNKENCFSLPWS